VIYAVILIVVPIVWPLVLTDGCDAAGAGAWRGAATGSACFWIDCNCCVCVGATGACGALVEVVVVVEEIAVTVMMAPDWKMARVAPKPNRY
jgi:hypothetical protein